MRLASLCFGDTDLGVFRIRKAAGRTDVFAEFKYRALNGVRASHEPLLQRLRDKHHLPSYVASSEDFRSGSPHVRINLDETALIGYDACTREIQRDNINHPPSRYYDERRLCTIEP